MSTTAGTLEAQRSERLPRTADARLHGPNGAMERRRSLRASPDSGFGGIYERSAPVTGTGPDLSVVGREAMAARIYRHSDPVTGTGPGLEYVADHS